MWTINDFPAYSMLSGWSTSGNLACPYCMEETQSFRLQYGVKTTWFDNHRMFLDQNHPFRSDRKNFLKGHIVTRLPPPLRSGQEILNQICELGIRKVTELDAEEVNKRICKSCGWKKRSIFWDLPYWSSNMIRHNLDVMHIEKNVFDNVFNTVLEVDGKTKDNPKARLDVVKYCNRPHLARNPDGSYPKAAYTINKDKKRVLFDWLEGVKFPDGYVSNMSRCLDTEKFKLFGMKNHDCHVFMQRLLPIAFRELLPSNVWQALTELSLFFKDLTSTTLRVVDLERLEVHIPQILCKLERIFPPGFFNSMEHLPVHLPLEARIAGPVQYRWMYPFERYLRTLKNMIGNKASVEGSICEAYLMAESTQLFSHYFEPHVMSRHHNVTRNDDGGAMKDVEGNLSIFTHPSRLSGEGKKRDLSLEEIKAAQTYILLNCQEVEPFVSMYVQRLQEEFPNLPQDQIDESLESYFPIWFKEYVRSNHIENEYLSSLAHGPLISACAYPVCFVNGYKFHTIHRGSVRSTTNSGVCISDPNAGDYYGRIQEIIQLEYRRAPLKQAILFKCEWFDPTMNVGVKEHNQYKLVDVNHRRRFKKYEPFILAMQATQVCYMSYPSRKRDKDDWLAVLKVKPRDVIESPDEGGITVVESNLPFQVEEVEVHEIDMNIIVDEDIPLHDPNGETIEMAEPINEDLLLDHHELEEETTEDEGETEEEDDEEFEDEIDTD
ncbi:uncharacterized protein [Solanum tuberosum]|uniref:uncharacterized protein n=1 Tax=Solanum tuberosum TaxID=4113 RepID=UPI00073A345B|nr:PREDICTED: uncharacterized protein LOC107057873 [Solanum tuberosum]